jgi:hypothetical protein
MTGEEDGRRLRRKKIHIVGGSRSDVLQLEVAIATPRTLVQTSRLISSI